MIHDSVSWNLYYKTYFLSSQIHVHYGIDTVSTLILWLAISMKYIIFIERIVYCGSILHKRSNNVNLMFSVHIKLYILMVKAKKVWLRTSLDEHMFVIGGSNSTLDFVYGWSILHIEWAINLPRLGGWQRDLINSMIQVFLTKYYISTSFENRPMHG